MSRSRTLAVVAAYALLSLALTWPVARTLTTRVPFYNDTWIFVWDVHQVRSALLDQIKKALESGTGGTFNLG